MTEFIVKLGAAIWQTATAMSPYLLFGFLMAGILSVFISPETVERHLGRKGFLSILKSTLFGVPLPLCSCGVIPVSASLRRHGASRGATTAFLLSTPQTGVDSIFVTFSLLGPFFAVFRPIIAFLTGLVGGTVIDLVEKDGSASPAHAPGCTDACCAADAGASRLARVFGYGFGTLARDIAKPLLLGILLAGLISAVVPPNMFAGLFGGGIAPMVMMMIIAIPLYVCATASVPLAAALMAAGFSPGAAFVFLMTGPATNAATIATIWKVLGRRTAVVYLTTVAGVALVSGLLLDYIFALKPAWREAPERWMLPGPVGAAAAVLLLAVLVLSLLRKPASAAGSESGEDRTELRITGMSCSHCADAVRRALLECPGVRDATVDLRGGTAAVLGEGAEFVTLKRAVEALGYGVFEEGRESAPPADAAPADHRD